MTKQQLLGLKWTESSFWIRVSGSTNPLPISASTLYAKLGVRNRDEAIEIANQAGLL
ncbi:hypothetical protein [Paenibacillus sp. LC231]|uniref:hypothetical protein n=1 Tax=Paenibacillus sp. LC231 TaxID=1120679 RepID=UPI000ADD1218|nr:hypothetical protein [Paenibacillus sp. LC231]